MAHEYTEYSQFDTVAKSSIRWMKAKFVWFLLSVGLIMVSLYVILSSGINTSIDFRGGTLIELGIDNKDITLKSLRELFHKQNFHSANIQKFGDNAVIINLPNQKNISSEQVVSSVKQVLSASYDKEINFRRVESLGPKVGSELMKTSMIAIIVSIIAMLLYIWIRFELPFAIGSVIALMHDVVITLGVLSFFQVEFGLPIIAALLTIVGYSMNDTVVIYDRIRENLMKYRRAQTIDVIDLSINEVITRSLVTSGTTLLSLVILLIYGGDILRPFILTMTVGILVGTYSSIFVASPVLLLMNIKNSFSSSLNKSKKSAQKQVVL